MKMLAFLHKISESLNKNSKKEITVFYTDFSKTFDKVPHRELLKKIAKMGVGSSVLHVLDEYLKDYLKNYLRN